MKQEYIDVPEGNEYDLLDEQLSSDEMFLVGFLKGFNRKNTMAWETKGLFDNNIEDFY